MNEFLSAKEQALVEATAKFEALPALKDYFNQHSEGLISSLELATSIQLEWMNFIIANPLPSD